MLSKTLIAIVICLGYITSYSFVPKLRSNFYINNNVKPNRVHIIKEYGVLGMHASVTSLKASVDDLIVEGMPNKARFQEFFKRTVTSLMSKDNFLQYDQVKKLIAENLVFQEDVDELWLSSVGDSTGLDVDEAYEMLCMLNDVPDPSDIQFLDTEFKSLTKNKSDLGFSKFLMWQDIQDILNDDALSMEEVTDLWRNVAGDLNTPINLYNFRKLNHLLDLKLENAELPQQSSTKKENSDDPLKFFDFDTLSEFKSYFESQMNSDRKITLESIRSWSDIKDMIADKVIDNNDVLNVWKEITQSSGESAIGYDDFLNFNVRIDLLMKEVNDDSVNEAEKNKNESELFYRSEFKNLMKGDLLMPIEILLEWKEIEELLQDDTISEKQIAFIFDSLAEPIGIPATSKGISVDSFVKLNQIIDSSLETSPSQTTSNNKKFDAFQSLPESAQSELMKPNTNESSTATSSEIELMTLLDSADNLLNAG